MNRGWAAFSSVLLAVAAAVVVLADAGPAAANHEDRRLWVTVAINAAGRDRLVVTDYSLNSGNDLRLASAVALALDRPPGSFRAVRDLGGAHVVLRDKLARPDVRGGLSYALDSGKLQVLAQNEGYKSVIVEVCAPRVRQVFDTLVAPEASPHSSPGSRCRGWFQPVEDPSIRAVFQLAPDRGRYPAAVGRVVGVAAIAFGLAGIGATLLRRGPLRRRSLASWLLSGGIVVGVVPLGWGAATVALWLSGAAADPMLLGDGSVGEQVARTLLPGLVFVLPALLPAVLLLSVPPKEKGQPPTSPATLGPSAVTWWPAEWWPLWAARRGSSGDG